MPRLEYFIVARAAAIDEGTNRLSIFEVVEELRSPHFPTIVNFAAIACFLIEPGDDGQDLQALFRVSGDALAAPHDFPLNFIAKGRRQRLLQRVLGLPVFKPGNVTFELLLNSQHQAFHHAEIAQGTPLG